MLFELEIWPDIPPDSQCPSSFQLLINREALKLKQLLESVYLLDLHLA